MAKGNLVESICAVTDPFCQMAKGAKWPDGLSEGSLPAQIRGHLPLASLGNGGNLIFLFPAVSTGYLPALSHGVGYLMASSYALAPGNTVVAPYAQNYRIVSAGVIIRNVCPALNTGGYMILTRLATVPAVSTTIADGNVYGVETATHALCAGMEVPVTFRPLGSSSRAFSPIAGGAVYPASGFDCVSVELVGCPNTTTMIDIEFVFNVEFTLTEANIGLQQFLPVVAPENPMMVKIANQASTTLSSLAHTGVEAFGRAAVSAIGKRVAAYFMGPAGAMALAIADAPMVD
jgi:hypothetical protein